MKTIQEQKVFQFSSLFVAASLVSFATLSTLSNHFDKAGVLFGVSSMIFLVFIYWLNGKFKNLNGFLSSYTSTYVSYTFLVVLHLIIYSIYNQDFFLENFYIGMGFLVYGYFFNIAISLVVYLLYKTILYFKQQV